MNDREVLDMAADHDEREALAALSARLERTSGAELHDPPRELRARVLELETPVRRPARRLARWLAPRPLAAGIATGAVAVLIAVVAWPSSPAGQFEGDARLAGAGDTASVQVRKIGIGRTVDFDSDSLPILPEGQFYELWFVGPGDSRDRPNRISAGTFHPDDQGRSHVQLKAAVDPASKGRLEVTVEPGDGDPRASGRVALQGRLPQAR